MKNFSKWKSNRLNLEQNELKCSALESNKQKNIDLFKYVAIIPKIIIKFLYPLYLIGKKNAHNIILKEKHIIDSNLPTSLEGLRILHISDLHLDEREDLVESISKLLEEQEYDICFFTGDYFSKVRNHKEEDYQNFNSIISKIKCKLGIYGVLGNHDSVETFENLSKFKIKFLNNECLKITINSYPLNVIGLDDVHYFYSDQVKATLDENKSDDFTILLVHSPEIYDLAQKNKVNLYLCGHTHGGQVRLTQKFPVFRRIKRGRKYFSGLWIFKNMHGHTSDGAGTSTLDIRFNCDPEISIIILNKSKIK